VNKCDTDNRSVLHVAVYMGHINLVKLLINNGSLVNQRDLLGRGILSTVLFSTVSNTQLQLDIAQILIACNADLNQYDNENKTPLILGVLENNYHFVNFLIKNNVDLDAIDNDGYTAITYAVKNNYYSLVDLLLKNNSATHILDKQGRSILSIVCSVGAKEVLRLLMDRGLDEMHRDNIGWTPLHEAAYAGYLDIAQMLINYGSEIDACDNEGKTSLFYACQKGNYELVKLLLNNNANINLKSHMGITPFRIACLDNKFKICEYLLQTQKIDINYLDLDGRTTLYCLICLNNKNIDMIKLLLDYGASVNTIDSDGRTCLHVTSTLGDLEIFSLLTKYNSNLEAVDNNGSTPLLTATWHDKINILKYLLNENVCRIDHQDKQGATALSIASQKGNYEIVNELLQHGAQIYASSRNPIKLAHQSGHTEIVKLLQQWTTMCYNPNGFVQKENASSTCISSCVPRNSKSVDSFRLNKNYKNEKFVQSFTNRCVVTPTTFSSYIKCSPSFDQNQSSSSSCRLPNSISASPGTYDYAKIEDLNRRFLNKNKSNDESNYLLNELKLSRFKQVKEKILRKSSTLVTSNPSLPVNKYPSKQVVESPTTPGNKSVTSFRLFISSLNSSNDHQQKKCQDNSGCLSNIESENGSNLNVTSSSSSKLKSSKSITNNTFVKMIRKKLRIFKSPSSSFNSKYNYSHQFNDLNSNEPVVVTGKQMQRSITENIALNNKTRNDLNLKNSISFGKNKTIQDDNNNDDDDDVAHIFNRNSLNDCLNPRSSYREFDSSPNKTNKLNNFSYLNTSSNIIKLSQNRIESNSSDGSCSSSINKKTDDQRNNIGININNNNNNNIQKRPNCLPINYFKKETSI